MRISEALWKMIFNLCANTLSKRFVAGNTIEDAVGRAKELKEKGIYAVINILGEHIKDYKEAGGFRRQYLELINKLAKEGLNGTNVAVKPSQLGLEISSKLYINYLFEILKQAAIYLPDSLVEIDREDHEYAGIVREISLAMARSFPNQRLACQVNLKETPEEIKQLIGAGISVRLCKGTAYPGDIKKERELRKIYFEQALLLDEGGKKPAIATHDLYLINRLKEKKNLEFQVLLGVENKELRGLAQKGRTVGFYVPCGPYWRPYGERRGKAIAKIWIRNHFYRVGKFFIEGLEKIGKEVVTNGKKSL